MLGGYPRADFEHCEVGFFLGKNPWLSHSIPRARVTLREIAKDPERCLIVVDPRRTETAEIADIHLQVKPGTDAWLLAAMIGVLVQEDRIARDWLGAHAEGLEEVLPHFEALPVADYCERCGIPEEQVRAAARRIAAAKSVASFEDLGVQMNRHSTLVSYLHKLLILLTGNFGKPGTAFLPDPPGAARRRRRARRGRVAPHAGDRLAHHRRAHALQRDSRGDPDRSSEALSRDAGRERESGALAGRRPAHARGARRARSGGGDRRGLHRDGSPRPLRAAGREPVRESRGDLLQLRVPGELLPPSPSAARSTSRPLLGGRAPRAPGRRARCAAGGRP